MTLNDILNGILNYNLNNLGRDIFPVIQGFVYFGGFLFLVFGVIFVSYYFYEEIKKWMGYKSIQDTNQSVVKDEIRIHKNDWVRVGNREGLYCYYCTKKLHLESWKNIENYYCDECYERLS